MPIRKIKIYKYLLFCCAVPILILNCSEKQHTATTISYKKDPSLTHNELVFLDTLQHRTFQYFLKEINPDKGLVKDRSTHNSPATIAAMGWALPVWAIGAEKGWISRDKAAQLTLNMLNFLYNSEQSSDSFATGYKGFYYHFLDMQEGRRFWKSELSSIDTAWLLGGIRFATQYFNLETVPEKKIRNLGEFLTNRVEWDFMTMPDSGVYALSISMGWRPESGLHPMGWIGYNEGQYLYILAAGCGYTNVQEAYRRWLSSYEWREPYPGLAHVVFPPLFGHQFTQLFLDLRGLADEYMAKKGIDYFENSRRATLVNRQYAMDNPLGWNGYDSLTWGISASDGPGPQYNFDDKKFHGYAGRGTAGPDLTLFDDGTLTPYAPLASIVFAPEIVLNTVHSWYDRFADKGLWGKYGMVDAFNLTANWFDEEYLGLDQGPIVIMIENYRSGLVWKYCMNDPIIKKGLDVLGFKPLLP